MGHTAGELAHRLQLLRLAELSLGALVLGDVLSDAVGANKFAVLVENRLLDVVEVAVRCGVRPL